MTKKSKPAALIGGLLAAAVAGSLMAAPADAAEQSCPAPDARPTVRFLDADSGVANRTAGGGCTVNDLIDDERTWNNHGAFVRHVSEVTRDLAGSSVISADERSALVETAARSGIGRPNGPTPYKTIFDGTPGSFGAWGYVGGRGFALRDDGSMVTANSPTGGGLGLLWYRAEQFGDFSLRLQFRDERAGDARSNSGVFVRFPGVDPAANPECKTNDPAWVSVNCGHEIQINDTSESGGNDPRKTGSVYGFADLDLAQARPTGKSVWNDLEIRVVGQHYTVIRNGEVINEFENVPGLPFPGRPTDPGTSGRQFERGYIGLQNHDAGSVVAFRNVRVRDLSDGGH
ncbi:hypothetical protein Pth03_31980 [Planotetraspora thailandica]|uniref:3-keto-alpha-glucoside-1,2-lyase/3-keto-2-hydroxy-glucal hydratase domain-containing protein n=1 Tax=Planotetraspora thailandica TaxID=487172 RepID=A0A8J3V6B4_9ACTN|nr:DUF1080 domain-containing protein [Planotetraspora thailandica]GII54809.1 hypothetical protein Pth03_31980 [Planotetraspora thailandica]